jgi:hypothetical protein
MQVYIKNEGPIYSPASVVTVTSKGSEVMGEEGVISGVFVTMVTLLEGLDALEGKEWHNEGDMLNIKIS